MPQHLTRTKRVHAMIKMLRQCPYSVGALADAFGVSVKTIYADLRLIQQYPWHLCVDREITVRVREA